eukprot:3177296-Prymnesium_polylepis.1
MRNLSGLEGSHHEGNRSACPSFPRDGGPAARPPVRGDMVILKSCQPCKSDYTTSQTTYQTCRKRPR